MSRRWRKAIDGTGRTVDLLERREHDEVRFRPDGSMRCCMPPRLYAPDGTRLIQETETVFRTPLGAEYRLIG